MEVHRQTCQKCDSIDVRNIIVRKPGRPMVVYVRCCKCKELVAAYEMSGYYHHGKGIESYLRAQGVEATDSARTWLGRFQRIQEEAASGFAEALEYLREQQKEV